MENEAIKTKVCSRCGRELPLTEFPKSAQCRDGHSGVCKKCKVEQMRDYRRNLAEKARLYNERGGAQRLHAPAAHGGAREEGLQGDSDLHGDKDGGHTKHTQR